jgi:hypothetical protein
MKKKKHDLRDDAGAPGEDANTNAKLAGHQDKVMPIADSGQHAVNPMPGGSKDGMPKVR